MSGINETQNDLKPFATLDNRGRSTQQSSALQAHNTIAGGHQTVFGSTFGATQRSNRSKNSGDEELRNVTNNKGFDIKVHNLAKQQLDG